MCKIEREKRNTKNIINITMNFPFIWTVVVEPLIPSAESNPNIGKVCTQIPIPDSFIPPTFKMYEKKQFRRYAFYNKKFWKNIVSKEKQCDGWLSFQLILLFTLAAYSDKFRQVKRLNSMPHRNIFPSRPKPFKQRYPKTGKYERKKKCTNKWDIILRSGNIKNAVYRRNYFFGSILFVSSFPFPHCQQEEKGRVATQQPKVISLSFRFPFSFFAMTTFAHNSCSSPTSNFHLSPCISSHSQDQIGPWYPFIQYIPTANRILHYAFTLILSYGHTHRQASSLYFFSFKLRKVSFFSTLSKTPQKTSAKVKKRRKSCLSWSTNIPTFFSC